MREEGNFFEDFIVEVSSAATIKSFVFVVVTSRGSRNIRRFGGTYRFRHQSEKNQQQLASVAHC
jgi:hypothetical protein